MGLVKNTKFSKRILNLAFRPANGLASKPKRKIAVPAILSFFLYWNTNLIL